MLGFRFLGLIALLLGVLTTVLTIIWVRFPSGSLAELELQDHLLQVTVFMGVVWDVTDRRLYNWHPICMVLGMIFFFGNCEYLN